MSDKQNFSAHSVFASRRSADGNVEVKLTSHDGRLLDLNLSPNAAFELLQSIFSTRGRSDGVPWNSFPFELLGVGRQSNEDGAITLHLLVGEKVSIPIRLTPEAAHGLAQAALKQGGSKAPPQTEH
ncbi:hypothetical protein HLB01_08700 [Bordetella trematum]|uniref:hypothetical protein n=1 Tax=Bordetella trematum TaxID=123899 RepID=UPI000F8D862D|nr:hypothetical protein [Bordetella trematum]NNH19111.1 hypothetical protein [Bordetella trematum]